MNFLSKNSSIGYTLEVDLEYPSELHDLYNDYTLAPEKLEINKNMLPSSCVNIANKYGIKIGGVPTLGNKSKYVVHYRNRKLYLSLGMKLTKTHRVLNLKQFDWLQKCVDFNTDKRKNATNNFEKIFFKLMINSVFGKTMENFRKIISVELINNAKVYVKCISKPSFVSQKIFSKNFVAIYKIKLVLTLNKSVYVGFSILDLSKRFMYNFHCKYMKNKFQAKLLFTDTDSLIHEIKTEDVYEDFYQDKNLFDFSEYPLDSKFFDPVNKTGKMKDEYKGKIISEFVGLKSKMYVLISVDDEELTKAKGVNKKEGMENLLIFCLIKRL